MPVTPQNPASQRQNQPAANDVPAYLQDNLNAVKAQMYLDKVAADTALNTYKQVESKKSSEYYNNNHVVTVKLAKQLVTGTNLDQKKEIANTLTKFVRQKSPGDKAEIIGFLRKISNSHEAPPAIALGTVKNFFDRAQLGDLAAIDPKTTVENRNPTYRLDETVASLQLASARTAAVIANKDWVKDIVNDKSNLPQGDDKATVLREALKYAEQLRNPPAPMKIEAKQFNR